MFVKYILSVLSIIALVTSEPSGDPKKIEELNTYSELLSDLWGDGAEVIRILLKDCAKKVAETTHSREDDTLKFNSFSYCMKRKSLRALDRLLNADEVPLANGIELVRYEILDRDGQVIQMVENQTSGLWTDNELDQGEWNTLVLERMARALRTHVIKVNLDPNNPAKAEFRHRRRHHMMTMMMFGIISMGLVIIPMGFQFLAVLGGKALLLAKMALLLSSIQGLKKVDDWNRHNELLKNKIATSPLSYGFYQNYPPGYDHFERRSFDTQMQEFQDEKGTNTFDSEERDILTNKQEQSFSNIKRKSIKNIPFNTNKHIFTAEHLADRRIDDVRKSKDLTSRLSNTHLRPANKHRHHHSVNSKHPSRNITSINPIYHPNN